MAYSRSALLAACLALCVSAASARTEITEYVLSQAGIIPDVVSGAALDPKLNFDIAFPSGAVDAGNLFSINASASMPSAVVSCKPGACSVPRRTYYTLLMVDPDAPSREMPTRRNIWHWGVVNAPKGRISKGTTVTTYRGPRPPMGVHRYTLLLFRQRGKISVPMTPDNMRANFNVNEFAQRYNLALPVAVNWFTSQPDAGP